MQAIEPGVERFDPVKADRQPYHQGHGDPEAEAHFLAGENGRVQGDTVRNQGDEEKNTLAWRHALLPFGARRAREDAAAPEHHAEAGIERGWNQMK